MFDLQSICLICRLFTKIIVCDIQMLLVFFFFQAEDGIRDLVRSRGLGDVYKRQGRHPLDRPPLRQQQGQQQQDRDRPADHAAHRAYLSLIHI
mgnify:CR=1 FL=1